MGCNETVLHRNGRVTECAHSNVHIFKDGVFITAPTDNLILPGIARKHLIAACGRLGIPVQERPYTVEELAAADEIMISSAGSLCLAAQELDGKPCGGKAPQLLKTLQDEVLREFLEETN
jgi:D-alanine transaminase